MCIDISFLYVYSRFELMQSGFWSILDLHEHGFLRLIDLEARRACVSCGTLPDWPEDNFRTQFTTGGLRSSKIAWNDNVFIGKY